MSGSYTLRPWTDVVHLHPDVESDNLTESVFAIDLGAIAEGDPNVPLVNRDPEAFFRSTYLTTDLERLLREVLDALTGDARSNRVLKLRTPFGGGKSHTLAALLHAARRHEALNRIPEAADFADPGEVDVAVFDGEKFSAHGRELPGGRTIQTMWGWIAHQLGVDAYRTIERLDQERVAPSGDDIKRMLAGGPKLILLDEVLKYIERTSAVPVHESTLARQAKDFFQNLTVEVSNSKNACMVYSLQMSERESLGNITLLSELDKLANRVDDLRQPVGDEEVIGVVKRRLLAQEPDAQHAATVANAFQDVVTKQRRAAASSELEQEQAETEGTRLRDEIKGSYPFHPAMLGVMRGRWASVEAFQRTRGALRFLAACLYSIKKSGQGRALLGPSDVPVADAAVRLALNKELGLNNSFDPIFFEDLTGTNARVRRIDERFAKESPALANVRPATRLATAILMYSFGGLRRNGDADEEMLPPGVTEQELLAACLAPDLDSITASAVLAELRTTCLYLHYDGVRYVFKKDPNVTKLIEEAESEIAAQEANTEVVKKKIKELLTQRLGGHRTAHIWTEMPDDIPDKEPAFLLGYLPLEFAGLREGEQEKRAKGIFENYRDRQRSYRNGLGLAVPQQTQVTALRRAVRYLLAIEKVESRHRQSQLRLTKDQLDQLRERRRTEEAAIESAFRDLYTAVWLPRVEAGQIGIDKVELTGRALGASGIHERMTELLTTMTNRVFGTLSPRKIVELLRLGAAGEEGQPARLGIKTSDVQDAFYSFLGFPRLTDASVLRRTIARGVEGTNSEFAYWSGTEPTLGSDGRYEVSRERVVFGRTIDASEIDLETGFIILPAALPATPVAAVTPVADTSGATTTPVDAPTGGSATAAGQPANATGQAGGASAPQTSVRLSFTADRNKLYEAWNAIANLAEQAGGVSINIVANKSDGFDQSWLRNAVYEPLEEADIVVTSSD